MQLIEKEELSNYIIKLSNLAKKQSCFNWRYIASGLSAIGSISVIPAAFKPLGSLFKLYDTLLAYKNNKYNRFFDFRYVEVTCQSRYPASKCSDFLDNQNRPLPGGACIELFNQIQELCAFETNAYAFLGLCLGLFALTLVLSCYFYKMASESNNLTIFEAKKLTGLSMSSIFIEIENKYGVNVDDSRSIKELIMDLSKLSANPKYTVSDYPRHSLL